MKGELQKEQPKDTSKYKAEIRVEKEIIKTVSASSPVACGQASVNSGKIITTPFCDFNQIQRYKGNGKFFQPGFRIIFNKLLEYMCLI